MQVVWINGYQRVEDLAEYLMVPIPLGDDWVEGFDITLEAVDYFAAEGLAFLVGVEEGPAVVHSCADHVNDILELSAIGFDTHG